MGNLGFAEMAVIAVFGLLVFGPQKLPEIARNVGGFIREFKSVTSGLTQELRMDIDSERNPEQYSRPPRPEPEADADSSDTERNENPSGKTSA